MNFNDDAEAIKALLEEEDWGFWRKCLYCDKQFPNFAAYVSHLRRNHKEMLPE